MTCAPPGFQQRIFRNTNCTAGQWKRGRSAAKPWDFAKQRHDGPGASSNHGSSIAARCLWHGPMMFRCSDSRLDTGGLCSSLLLSPDSQLSSTGRLARSTSRRTQRFRSDFFAYRTGGSRPQFLQRASADHTEKSRCCPFHLFHCRGRIHRIDAAVIPPRSMNWPCFASRNIARTLSNIQRSRSFARRERDAPTVSWYAGLLQVLPSPSQECARCAGEFWRWCPAGDARICRNGTDRTGRRVRGSHRPGGPRDAYGENEPAW